MTDKKIWQFCVAGTAVGMAVLFYGLYIWLNAESQAKWPVVQGKIVSSVANSHRTYGSRRGSSRSDRSEVDYSYLVSGQNFQASQHKSGWKFSHKYPKGTMVSIHYDPTNPSKSILEPLLFEGRAYTWVGFVFCVGIPIATMVFTKQMSSSQQTGLSSFVQDPTDQSEVLAWKQRNGMPI